MHNYILSNFILVKSKMHSVVMDAIMHELCPRDCTMHYNMH